MAPANPPTARQLAALAVPALFVGVGCALVLIGVSVLAGGKLQHVLWTTLPDVVGVADGSRWWTFGGVLTRPVCSSG